MQTPLQVSWPETVFFCDRTCSPILLEHKVLSFRMRRSEARAMIPPDAALDPSPGPCPVPAQIFSPFFSPSKYSRIFFSSSVSPPPGA